MNFLERYPRIGRVYERFVKIRGNPHEIGLGLALGFYVGMTPFLGFHVLAAVFIAALLKWNKIAAGLGAWITNPISAPFIYGLNWYVGAKITGMELTRILPAHFEVSELARLMMNGPEIIWTLMVGGMITGIPLAFTGYFLTRLAVRYFRSSHNP